MRSGFGVCGNLRSQAYKTLVLSKNMQTAFVRKLAANNGEEFSVNQ